VCVFVCVCVSGGGGVSVDTGLFSSLLSVVNRDYEMLTWKVYQGCGRVIFLLGRTVKTIENFRQISSGTGHLLVCYHITFCILQLHKCCIYTILMAINVIGVSGY